MMSEEKSGDHQSPSRVSTKSNGNPSDACRDALTKWTKQDFHFTAVVFPNDKGLAVHFRKIKRTHEAKLTYEGSI